MKLPSRPEFRAILLRLVREERQFEQLYRCPAEAGLRRKARSEWKIAYQTIRRDFMSLESTVQTMPETDDDRAAVIIKIIRPAVERALWPLHRAQLRSVAGDTSS
jgi:hypothetical protein